MRPLIKFHCDAPRRFVNGRWESHHLKLIRIAQVSDDEGQFLYLLATACLWWEMFLIKWDAGY